VRGVALRKTEDEQTENRDRSFNPWRRAKNGPAGKMVAEANPPPESLGVAGVDLRLVWCPYSVRARKLIL
jgi:hypothetical protein